MSAKDSKTKETTNWTNKETSLFDNIEKLFEIPIFS